MSSKSDAPADSADTPPSRLYGGGKLVGAVALPFGREGARWSQAAPAFDLGIQVGLKPIPLALGLDVVGVAGPSSPVDVNVYDTASNRTANVVMRRSVSAFKMDLSLRLQPYGPSWLPVRPYATVLLGFQVISTKFKGSLNARDVSWTDDQQLSGALGWELGVDVILGGHLGFVVALRRYYGPSMLAAHALLAPDQTATIQYGQPTNLTMIMFGLCATS